MTESHASSASALDDQIGQQTTAIALLGNPNTGKSTIFNVLSGLSQKIGNYPGVTVEKRTGRYEFRDQCFEVVDLPGTYSLAPRSPDEMLSVNVLLGNPPATKPPDVIVCVVDASNLERNLYLVSQILELQQPTVIALNMIDVSEQIGLQVDSDKLSKILGVPVVPTQADRGIGITALQSDIALRINTPPDHRHQPFSHKLGNLIERLENIDTNGEVLNRFLVTRMLFDTDGYMIEQMEARIGTEFMNALKAERAQMMVDPVFAQAESNGRYAWLQSQLASVVTAVSPSRPSATDPIDRWLTHPVFGVIIAILVMAVTFQLVFWVAEPASVAIDWLAATATGWVDNLFIWLTGSAEGALHSLVVNGLIAGVGGVLVFLPQIMLLFFLLAILEDCGYLARLAFLMDKYLSRIGLSGITVIPLLSSFACAIPGIMATRVIKNERERLVTILVAPLMSCSARLPVYTLLIAAFVPAAIWFGLGLQGLTMFAMYGVGIVAAICVAWILKKTLLRSGTSSFVMELPTYKVPRLRNIWRKTYNGGAAFVKDAGTIIVAATIIVWAAAYFPRNADSLPAGLMNQRSQLASRLDAMSDESPDFDAVNMELLAVDNRINSQFLRNSYLGRAGKWIEPVVEPIGWDWRLGSAAIASFPAREVVVSTMGVLFGLGDDINEEDMSLNSALKNATWDDTDRKLFSLPVALSMMVFFALCAQCSSTLAVIKRETNSWFWPAFTFVYMTALAYAGAFLAYQVSSYFSG